MATYAIGDIQGCYDPLQLLLEQINFDASKDQLWFAGDLVNRGPKSLETLRFVMQLGDRAITVLGNHDLHLLAVAEGKSPYPNSNDTLDDILNAADRDELLHWLRQQPLMHRDSTLGYSLIHAGLPPQWTIEQTQRYAQEVEAVLRSEQYLEFFDHMYGNLPDQWHEELKGWDRLRFIVNCFTRLRFCSTGGKLAFSAKGGLGTQPKGLHPWFQLQERKSQDETILFGHWSTLGLYQQDNVIALDTGCLWGGALTALCLETREIHQLDCPQTKSPHKLS